MLDERGIGAEVVVGEALGDAVDVVVEPGDDPLGARRVGVAEAFVKGEGAGEERSPRVIMGGEVAAKLDGLLHGGEEMGAAIRGEGVLKGVEKLTKRGGEGGGSIRFGTTQSVHDGGVKIVGEVRYGCVHEGPEFCGGAGMVHGPRGESVFTEVAVRVEFYECLAEVLQR